MGDNCIVEIHAKPDDEEATLFAGDLVRMYLRWGEAQGYKVELACITENDIGGFSEAIFIVRGNNAYRHLRREMGVHNVKRAPWLKLYRQVYMGAANVSVYPEAADYAIPEDNLRIDVYSSFGIGATDIKPYHTCVRVTHLPTGMVVSCQDERSQVANRDKALLVLRSRLADIDGQQKHGRGDRDMTVRTYDFTEGRVTDHRLDRAVNNIADVMNGDLSAFMEALP